MREKKVIEWRSEEKGKKGGGRKEEGEGRREEGEGMSTSNPSTINSSCSALKTYDT